MQSRSIDSEMSPPAPTAPTMGDGAQAWSELCARLSERARLDAEIIELTGQVQRSGTIETLEGVTLDTALNLVHRLPAAERGMLLTAVDVLADMPATMALLKAQVLSWGQVRGIVAETKRLSKDGRAIVDAHIGASHDRFAKLDPDDALDAVRIVVEEVRGLRATERSAEAIEKANFLWGQPGMFGSGKLFSQMDNTSLAETLNGIDACAPADDGRPLSHVVLTGWSHWHACDWPAPATATATAASRAADAPGPRQTTSPAAAGATPTVVSRAVAATGPRQTASPGATRRPSAGRSARAGHGIRYWSTPSRRSM